MFSDRKDIIVMSAFISIIVTVGYIFIWIPNVELVTASIFVAGYLLGVKKGIVIGVFAEFLYSLLNPYGIAQPPLLLAQIISMGIVGCCGGLIRYLIFNIKNRIIYLILLGIAGFFLTTLFDFLTTVSFALFMAETSKKIIASIFSSIVYGMPFYFTHIFVNTCIFIIVVPLMIKALQKLDKFNEPT